MTPNTLHKIGEEIRAKKSAYWERLRKHNALSLFSRGAADVPAYAAFLKKNKIDPAAIRNFEDFETLPITNKEIYLRKFPLHKLCHGGTLAKSIVYAATSGSTGKPFYFPHEHDLEAQYSVLAEMYLRNIRADTRSTLIIIGFGMGVWIGGVLTYEAFNIASRRSAPVSILTPGINRAEIFHALRDLAPQYEQTVLIGYPPFVKDIIDDAPEEGIMLSKLNMRLLFAAESFTEDFRDHLMRGCGITDPCNHTLNIYGTADFGAMAFETPTSILIRRLLSENESRYQEIFGSEARVATLAQYNPHFACFESHNGEILLTGDSTVPLLRYAIGDRGGVFSFAEMERALSALGIDLRKEAHMHHVRITELPFVFVFERVDFAVKLYGAMIYPAHIKNGFSRGSTNKLCSGRFTMQTKHDARHNQYLEINVELRPGVKKNAALTKQLTADIVSKLIEQNAEYRSSHQAVGKRAVPKLVFWPYQDPKYFARNVKQKWVIKGS